VRTRGDKHVVQKAKTNVQIESLQLSSSLSPLDLTKEFSLSFSKVVETNPGEGSSASPVSRSEPVLHDAELIGQVFVHSWDVQNQDLFSDPYVCAKVVQEFATPGQRLVVGNSETSTLLNNVFCSWAQMRFYLPFLAGRLNGVLAHQEWSSKRLSVVHRKLRDEASHAEDLAKQVDTLKAEKEESYAMMEKVKEEFFPRNWLWTRRQLAYSPSLKRRIQSLMKLKVCCKGREDKMKEALGKARRQNKRLK
jgi:hypothetical protein